MFISSHVFPIILCSEFNTSQTAYICNVCIVESCDMEITYTPPAAGAQFPLAFTYLNNRSFFFSFHDSMSASMIIFP